MLGQGSRTSERIRSSLPINGVTKIHIPRTKNEAQKPNEEILQLRMAQRLSKQKAFKTYSSAPG